MILTTYFIYSDLDSGNICFVCVCVCVLMLIGAKIREDRVGNGNGCVVE